MAYTIWAGLVVDGSFVADRGNKRMLKQLFKGLNANQLKWIALVSMTIDNINVYLLAAGASLVQDGLLSKLGRIAAPLFLFVLTESVRYTKEKRRLISRLYIAGVLGSLFTIFCVILANEFVLSGPIYMGVSKNILFTYTYTAIYICLLELGIKAVRTKNLKGVFFAVMGVVITFLPQLAYNIYDGTAFPSINIGSVSLGREVLTVIFPPVYFIEYSLIFVLMGICIYFAKGKWKCLIFAVYCVLSCLGAPIISNLWPFTDFFWPGQAWMILALPFMILYNGEKGTAHKSLFYVYYPVHKNLLSFVGVLMGTYK